MANKLYQLSYISDSIEQFARNMLLAAVDQHVSDVELSQSGSSKQRVEGEVCHIFFKHFSPYYILFSGLVDCSLVCCVETLKDLFFWIKYKNYP